MEATCSLSINTGRSRQAWRLGCNTQDNLHTSPHTGQVKHFTTNMKAGYFSTYQTANTLHLTQDS